MLGVYVHFPYCRKRCPYCDFAIHVRRRIPHEAYAEAVCRELRERAPLVAGRALASVYFGGGTPSLWEPACVERVVGAARAAFSASGESEARPEAQIEVTLEANPDDLPRERLEAFRAAGVDRLSIGAQSFDPAQLAALGRLHGPDETRRAVAAARAAGFDNVSLDLMFGLPGQDLAHLGRELDALLELAPEHLSMYQLTVEERTPFGAFSRRGELRVPEPEPAADMQLLVEERARAAGFERYEVSSYARPGRRAVHNSLYWQGGEWLGLGSAAHSFRRTPGGGPGGERWSNVKNVDEYLRRVAAGRAAEAPSSLAVTGLVGLSVSAGGAPAGGLSAHHEPLDEDALSREAMWLGLRLLADGVDRAAFAARFGADPADRFASVLRPLVEGALVEAGGRALRLTPRGALLADEVGLRFL